MSKLKVFYARHTYHTETELIIKIKAKDKETAQKINDNWCPGTKNKNVRVINKEVDNQDYSASDVREQNNFYD